MDKEKRAYDELVKGLQRYIDHCVDNSGYDKTYTAIIKNKTVRGYTIMLNGNIYDNVQSFGGECKVNETVRVLIPQNNFNNMFILKGGVGGDIPESPVLSVNNKTGHVYLTSSDVSAVDVDSEEIIDIDFSGFFG